MTDEDYGVERCCRTCVHLGGNDMSLCKHALGDALCWRGDLGEYAQWQPNPDIAQAVEHERERCIDAVDSCTSEWLDDCCGALLDRVFAALKKGGE